MQKVDIKKLNAMTLLELIVVVALIGILSTSFMVDNNVYKDKRVAIGEAQKLYSFLTNIQNIAFSENEVIQIDTTDPTLVDSNKTNDPDNIYTYDLDPKADTTFVPTTFIINNDRTFSSDVNVTITKDGINYNRIVIYGNTGFIMKQAWRNDTWVEE